MKLPRRAIPPPTRPPPSFQNYFQSVVHPAHSREVKRVTCGILRFFFFSFPIPVESASAQVYPLERDIRDREMDLFVINGHVGDLENVSK